MTTGSLIRRSLAYYARSHAAVALAVMTGSAVLTGALLIGDSMRGSLLAQALQRLAGVNHALISPRFFTEHLASQVHAPVPESRYGIILSAQIMHTQSRARENRVTVMGLATTNKNGIDAIDFTDEGIILNASLSQRIGAKKGDEVIISVARTQVVPAETLLGRRDELSLQFRLPVSAVLPDDSGFGGFSPTPTTQTPLNAFVPLATLQRLIKQTGRVNAILTTGNRDPDISARLEKLIREQASLEDYDLSVRIDNRRGYFAVASRRILIDPPIERAARDAAVARGHPSEAILAYLINDLAKPDQPTGIPYSVAAAIESTAGLTLTDGKPAPPLDETDIFINTWAADDLGAKVGDTLRLKYFVSRPFGKLEESTTTLTLRGVVKMTGDADDPGMTPTYEGITTTDRLSEWDAPFPMDMKNIRPKDEEYWKQHRATPKAFVSLKTGQQLWGEAEARFGSVSSIRVTRGPDQAAADLTKLTTAYSRELLSQINPTSMGLRFEPLRQRAIAGATGSTDFGMLFIGFSMFLIAAAGMLVMLVFKLGVERRAREIGLLLAVGLRGHIVSRLLWIEGTAVALIGVLIGTFAAMGYAWMMLAGLRTWWALPGDMSLLQLHCDGPAMWVGPLASLLIAVCILIWSVRSLSRASARSLLSGSAMQHTVASGRNAAAWSNGIAVVAALSAVAVVIAGMASKFSSSPVAFFSAGALLLTAGLAAIRGWTVSGSREPLSPSQGAVARLGVRNARRNPGRSMLAAGLTACATFVVLSVGVYRHDVNPDDRTRSGGLGGFALLAQSIAPIAEDLGTPQGRAAIGLSTQAVELLRGSSIQSFRVQPGEDASCENLFKVSKPRILGAPENMVKRGGFSFAGYIDATPTERLNPWRLLDRTFDDGAIPVIADANTATWLLHLKLGEDWPLVDERGRAAKLRLVATLSGSVLQGELIVGETGFKQLFPSVAGYSFFLIDVPHERAEEVESVLEYDLSHLGFDATETGARLSGFRSIENTYLSTFQSLGGLGLVLGTLGLAAVMLRNILERRRELALLRAVGFSRANLRGMVLAENASLLAAGLATGIMASAVAVGPQMILRASQAPWGQLMMTLALCVLVGLSASALATRAVTRAPLLASLRRD